MNTRGFTLVEILVVFAMSGLVLAMVGPLSVQVLQKSQVAKERVYVEQQLHLAQARTVSGYQDSVWGVHLTSSQSILFAGATYAARNQTFDQIHSIPSGIIESGLTDVVYLERTGKTAQTGSILFTQTSTGNVKTLTINENGRTDKP